MATISSSPKTTVIERMFHVRHYENEHDTFELKIAGQKKRVEFYWMSEARSSEIDEVETALKRLAKYLEIPFDYEEKP